jgi:methyl-accepting chemotaxis protein
MLNNIRIGARLALGFGSVILVAALALVAAILVGRFDHNALEQAHQDAMNRMAIVQAMRESELMIVSSIRSAGLQTDGAMLNADVDAFKSALKSLVDAERRFSALPLDAEEQAMLGKVVTQRQAAEPLADEAIKYTMAFAGDQAAKVLTDRFAPVERIWSDQMSKLVQLQGERNARARAELMHQSERRQWLFAGLLVLLVLGTSWFAVAMTRSVTAPLREASSAASLIAEGNLAVHLRAQGKDEAADLLKALQAMAHQLAVMVNSVRESAESIDMASREIAQGNLDLSTRTEQQASSVQATSHNLHELTGTVHQTSHNAQSVRELADQTANLAEQGSTAMSAVSSTMTGISEASRRIADIIGVIDGIAFQTNILALNAAVEAARAGEQGRGFAVVAGEVRSLAQRVTTAASEVRQLIGTSVERVEDGARQVDGLGQTLSQLSQGVGKVRTLVAEISTASARQSSGIVQVNDSVRAIDATTQQNSALVEQVAAAAQSLSSQTERLSGLVRRFRVEA